MKEHRQYQVAEDGEEEVPQVSCPVCEQPWEPWRPQEAEGEEEGEMPPSVLILRFAGPGSALVQVIAHGIVTREQEAAAIFRLFQDWIVPIFQMVAENTIATFMEALTKPRIEAGRMMPPGSSIPPFFMPPRGGGPA